MNEILLSTVISVLSGFIGMFFSLWVAKRGEEGRSKYEFEKALNRPRKKSGAFDALVNAIDKLLTRKPKERIKRP